MISAWAAQLIKNETLVHRNGSKPHLDGRPRRKKKHGTDNDGRTNSFCEIISCGPHRSLWACYVRPPHRKIHRKTRL